MSSPHLSKSYNAALYSGRERAEFQRKDKIMSFLNVRILPAYNDSKEGSSAIIWLIITALSAFVTFALMIVMSRMIATEFQLQDKLSSVAYDINPVEKLLITVKPVTEPEPYKTVEVPPPPPDTGFHPSEKVVVAPYESNWEKPVFKPDTDLAPMNPVIVAEKEYAPIQRVAPIMPPRATRSGHCVMRFDVSVEGLPFNVQAVSCSEPLFAKPSVKAVQRWKYLPRVKEGRSVSVKNVTTRISFNLTDERGQLIAARE